MKIQLGKWLRWPLKDRLILFWLERRGGSGSRWSGHFRQ